MKRPPLTLQISKLRYKHVHPPASAVRSDLPAEGPGLSPTPQWLGSSAHTHLAGRFSEKYFHTFRLFPFSCSTHKPLLPCLSIVAVKSTHSVQLMLSWCQTWIQRRYSSVVCGHALVLIHIGWSGTTHTHTQIYFYIYLTFTLHKLLTSAKICICGVV